jgi:hypothetical protein
MCWELVRKLFVGQKSGCFIAIFLAEVSEKPVSGVKSPLDTLE